MPFLEDNPPPSEDSPLDVLFNWTQKADAHIGSLGTQVQGNLVLVQVMIEALALSIGIPQDEWQRNQQIARMRLLSRIMPNAERVSLQSRLSIAKP